jgi:hypothetical protein
MGFHPEDAGKRRSHGAQPWKKFGEEQRAGSLPGENSLGTPNAGIRLERNFAEQLKDPDALLPPELIPDGVRADSRDHAKKQGGKKIQPAGASQSAGSEQQGHGWNGKPDLFAKNPCQKYGVSMMEKKFNRAVHGLAGFYGTKLFY